MINIKEKIWPTFLFFLFIFADQISKYHAKNIFRNYNFAFSLVLPKFLIYVIYFVLLFLLCRWFWRKKNKNFQIKLGFVLIFSGALSNIFERIYLGYVRDFIYIHTGVLNVADFFIIIGILLLLFDYPSFSKKI